MKKKGFVIFVILLIASTVLWSAGTAEKDEIIVIKAAHVNAPDHPAGLALQLFKEELESRSNNQIQVDLYHSAALGSERDIIEGCQLGTIDFGIAAANVIQSFSRVHDIFSLPFLFRDADHLTKVLEGPLRTELEDGMEEIGLKALGYSSVSPRQIYAREPIFGLEDLKGLELRVMEVDTIVKTMDVLDVKAVPLAFGEVYMALQMGTIDGAETTIPAWYRTKHFEVAPYLLVVNYMQSSAGFFTGMEFFNSLSNEHQKMLEESVEIAVRKANEEYRKQDLQIIEQTIPEKHPNVEVIYPTDKEMDKFRQASQEVYDTYPPALGDEWIKKIRETR